MPRGASADSANDVAGGHRAAKRSLELLEHVVVSPEPVTLSDLAREVDLPKSSAHALLRTLNDEGYLIRDAAGAYSVGPRLLRLVARVPERLHIGRLARPIMEDLAEQSGETVVLGVRQEAHVVYIEEVEGPSAIRYVAPLGEPRPLHATSIGKLLLAYGTQEEREQLFAGGVLERFTDRTLVDTKKLRAELLQIRSQGYALNRGESMPGIAGVAAPVLDFAEHIMAGLSVTGPAERVDEAALTPLVVKAAAQIGALIAG